MKHLDAVLYLAISTGLETLSSITFLIPALFEKASTSPKLRASIYHVFDPKYLLNCLSSSPLSIDLVPPRNSLRPHIASTFLELEQDVSTSLDGLECGVFSGSEAGRARDQSWFIS